MFIVVKTQGTYAISVICDKHLYLSIPIKESFAQSACDG